MTYPAVQPYRLGGGAGWPVVAIKADGPIFREAATGAPWRYRGVTAFKLCHRFSAGEDIDPFLADYAGFNTLRVWDYVGPGWGAQAWNSNTPDEWIAFVRYVAAKGWYVELTLLTDDDPKRIEPAKRLIAALKASIAVGVFLEAGNEPTTNGKEIDTHALRSELERSGFHYCSGDYEDSDRWYGSYYTCHTARTHDWTRRAHDLYEFYTGAGPDKPHQPRHVPCLGDEPGKVQDVGAVLSEWRAYFGACSIMGGGALVHLETAKYAQRPTDQERTVIAAALDGMAAFPQDAPLGPYRRIVEPGQPPEGRTYAVGNCMVRCQQNGTEAPEPGWHSLDSDGVLFTR